MYKRLIILTVIIAAALSGLTVLGYHAIEKWSEGLKWKQFAEVAEQIRQHVEHKLDDFIREEEKRPYTDYQFYYITDNMTNALQQVAVVRSPLGGQLEQGLAYGHFQIEEGIVTTANDDIMRRDGANWYNAEVDSANERNRSNVKTHLLPALGATAPTPLQPQLVKATSDPTQSEAQLQTPQEGWVVANERQEGVAKAGVERTRVQNFPIDALQRQDRQRQVIEQDNTIYQINRATNAAGMEGGGVYLYDPQLQANALAEQRAEADDGQAGDEVLAYNQIIGRWLNQEGEQAQSRRAKGAGAFVERVPDGTAGKAGTPEVICSAQSPREAAKQADSNPPLRSKQLLSAVGPNTDGALGCDVTNLMPQALALQNETVQVGIEPFRPIVTGGVDADKSVFGKQIFLVRDVYVQDRHFRQGFQLNEAKLIEEVKKSAVSFMRDGMSFELPQTRKARPENGDAAYTAVLDFGFGYLPLYLRETVPAVLVKQASQLRTWYFGIVGVVFLAVTLALVSLWRYARAQLKLAQKKDDFISAVSHELRTPLTSIRMYSEMLEKSWVKSEEKVVEYYRSMRQESERLSRLIENVLDFSRIQKGRKKYTFSVGDLNDCIAGVVAIMRPYAAQNGFSIETELEQFGQIAFDRDAIKQIIVNLLDNAIKYAREAEDKTVTVRTKSNAQFILIEVEDHGPGVPHRQRKRIFEEFYRLGSEATRETTGTGLGLALVKRFAQAHNGFVEILAAKPAGSIFRVGLALQS